MQEEHGEHKACQSCAEGQLNGSQVEPKQAFIEQEAVEQADEAEDFAERRVYISLLLVERYGKSCLRREREQSQPEELGDHAIEICLRWHLGRGQDCDGQAHS